MRIYFLPSEAQRRRKNGMPQPHRFFLANGTELPGVFEVQGGPGELTIMVLKLDAKVVRITKRPGVRK